MNESVLPKRSGSRPRTTPTNPHTQLEQHPEREVVWTNWPGGSLIVVSRGLPDDPP